MKILLVLTWSPPPIRLLSLPSLLFSSSLFLAFHQPSTAPSTRRHCRFPVLGTETAFLTRSATAESLSPDVILLSPPIFTPAHPRLFALRLGSNRRSPSGRADCCPNLWIRPPCHTFDSCSICSQHAVRLLYFLSLSDANLSIPPFAHLRSPQVERSSCGSRLYFIALQKLNICHHFSLQSF